MPLAAAKNSNHSTTTTPSIRALCIITSLFPLVLKMRNTALSLCCHLQRQWKLFWMTAHQMLMSHSPFPWPNPFPLTLLSQCQFVLMPLWQHWGRFPSPIPQLLLPRHFLPTLRLLLLLPFPPTLLRLLVLRPRHLYLLHQPPPPLLQPLHHRSIPLMIWIAKTL
jgi:hypothetical protein